MEEARITNQQREALKKIFSLYENYEVMSCEAGSNWTSYARDIVDALPELILAFPKIVLELDDSVGVFKSIIKKGGK